MRTRKRKKPAFYLLLLACMIGVLSICFLLILQLPEFNLKLRDLKSAHGAEIDAALIKYEKNLHTDPAFPPPSDVDVKIVYEYTSTCSIALAKLKTNTPKGNQTLFVELRREEENGEWSVISTRDFTYAYDEMPVVKKNVSALFRQKPDYLHCSD